MNGTGRSKIAAAALGTGSAGGVVAYPDRDAIVLAPGCPIRRARSRTSSGM
jgi:hypothetical protein